MGQDRRGTWPGRRRVGHREIWAAFVAVVVVIGCAAAPLFWPVRTVVDNAAALFVVVFLITTVVQICREAPPRSVLLGGLRAGALGAAVVMAVSTYVEMGGAAVWWLVGIVAATSPRATALLASRLGPGDTRGPAPLEQIPSGPAPVWTAHPGRVDSMSTPELVAAWRGSGWQLRTCRSAADMTHLVRLRQAYLDELERRDPAGVEAWMRSGPRVGTDPGTFLSADSEWTDPAA